MGGIMDNKLWQWPFLFIAKGPKLALKLSRTPLSLVYTKVITNFSQNEQWFSVALDMQGSDRVNITGTLYGNWLENQL